MCVLFLCLLDCSFGSSLDGRVSLRTWLRLADNLSKWGSIQRTLSLGLHLVLVVWRDRAQGHSHLPTVAMQHFKHILYGQLRNSSWFIIFPFSTPFPPPSFSLQLTCSIRYCLFVALLLIRKVSLLAPVARALSDTTWGPPSCFMPSDLAGSLAKAGFPS